MITGLRRSAVTFICNFLGTISADTAARFGAALGLLAFHLGLRRRVVYDNLRLALGLRGAARHAAARKSYLTMGANFIEMWTIGNGRGPELNVEIAEPNWTARMRRDCPGTVLLTLHLGSWDMAGVGGRMIFGRANVYAKAQRDAILDELINRQRKRAGMDVVLARHGQRTGAVHVLRGLRQGIPVGLLADQKPSSSEGIPAFFLGVPCLCHAGPAFFARREEVPIIPAFCLRVAAGRFRWFMGRPFPVAGMSDEQAIQRGMDQLSAIIAAFPGQYFWHHRRFRSPVTGLEKRAREPWRQHGLRLLVQ
jgi:KDO2-lipid IV(A) lauroyltransferase